MYREEGRGRYGGAPREMHKATCADCGKECEVLFTGFGSDNHSGVHPEILHALQSVNDGYVIAYGNDEYTTQAIKKLKQVFGKDTAIFFVYNGTAANILGLRSVTDSFHSIFCAESAHLTVHE
ncbi:MAG: threonine aldolase, partial [Thermoplasmatales archaeon]|nr:threonine aldolase [Thermoplasmatales archaeon]